MTNYRDAKLETGKYESRGRLVTDFLEAVESPLDYVSDIDDDAYAGFNLLDSDGRDVAYRSNRGVAPHLLEPGLYGLSNSTLDSPWHKVERSKAGLRRLLEGSRINESNLMRLLDDREKAPASTVSSERLPFATAHALTAPFIVLPDYGTRCSTTVLQDSEGRWRFRERRFDAGGACTGESREEFPTQA